MIALARLEGPLRHALHRFKYEDRPQLARPLVTSSLVERRVAPWAIVPVPLHASRRRRRGYNQAELLARELAAVGGVEVIDGLRRVRPGRQVGRGGASRREALAGAFVWTAAERPDAVVVLDDVLTTGSTLLECALAVRAAGVARVDTLALALG
jgi:ComF family protein